MRHLAAVLIGLVLPASALAASADTTGPKIKLTGLPTAGSCKKSVTVAFKITDGSNVKRIVVFYDRREVGRREPGDTSLAVHFPKRSRPGRHRLGVIARDNVGNVSKKVVHFRLCKP